MNQTNRQGCSRTGDTGITDTTDSHVETDCREGEVQGQKDIQLLCRLQKGVRQRGPGNHLGCSKILWSGQQINQFAEGYKRNISGGGQGGWRNGSMVQHQQRDQAERSDITYSVDSRSSKNNGQKQRKTERNPSTWNPNQ